MKSLNVGDINRFSHIMTGDVLELPGKEPRSITLVVNSSDVCSIFADASEDMADRKLVATVDGLTSVTFRASGPVFVQFASSTGAHIELRDMEGQPVTPPSVDEAYTTPEPFGRRNTEVDRMIALMKMNEKKRDQELHRALQEIDQRRNAVIEPEPQDEKPPVIEDNPKKEVKADEVSTE